MIRLLEPWRTRLLWASVALNLFALCLLATPAMWHRHPPPGFPGLVERMARRLPPADAERLRSGLAPEQPWFDQARQDLEQARIASADRIGQTPYDAQATRAALAQVQEQLRAMSARFDGRFADIVGTLSPEGRAKLADALRRRRP